MACRNRTLVFVLFLTFMGFTESSAGKTERLKICRRQLQKCSLSNKCFSNLKGLKKECEATASPRFTKSLFSNETLYFAPHINSIEQGDFPKTWTYSVFLGDDRDGNNLQLVDNCCKLRKGDTCDMPATFDKSKAFFVIFPYKKKKRKKLYCYHRVDYNDAPIDMCEEGKPIIDRCIYFDNGDFKLKYQFKPLQPGLEDAVIAHNGCYFTIRSDMLPDNVTLRYNQPSPTPIPTGQFTIIPEGNRSKDNPTGHICKQYYNVNSQNYETIVKEALDPNIGDIVCFKAEKLWGIGEKIDIKPVLCQRVKVNARPLQVWRVAVPITAFACLIILIGSVRFCRTFLDTKIEAISGLNLTKDDDSLTTKSHTAISTDEEFYPIQETEESATTDPYDNMTSESTDFMATDGESGEVSSLEADEKKLMAEGTTRIATEDDAESVSAKLTPSTSCATHTPYICKDFGREEAEKASVGSGYVKKHFKMNISEQTPSTTGYISKYLKKNLRARSPTASDACA